MTAYRFGKPIVRHERGACPKCGRDVALVTPRGGDGSEVRPARHKCIAAKARTMATATKNSTKTKFQKGDPIEFQREVGAAWEPGAYMRPRKDIGRSWHELVGAEHAVMLNGKQIGTTVVHFVAAQRIRARAEAARVPATDPFMAWCESVKPCKYCRQSFVGPVCPCERR